MENFGAYSAKPLDKLPIKSVTEWENTAAPEIFYAFLAKIRTAAFTAVLFSILVCFYFVDLNRSLCKLEAQRFRRNGFCQDEGGCILFSLRFRNGRFH